MPRFFYDHRLSACATERSGKGILVVVHNHPSGEAEPSAADIAMTEELRSAAEKLGIAIHDHLVIARAGHASFRSLGLL
ncbi:MAG: JAB domain-containing protein [Kiloniellaceae bacterium]